MHDDALLASIAADAEWVTSVITPPLLGSAVPSCPGWDLRDLVHHLGAVHRWAGAILRDGKAPWQDHPEGLTDEALRDWFAGGAHQLVAALQEVDLQRPTWTLEADLGIAWFWLRRQALETAVHRVDAALAVGSAHTDIPRELAAVGVGEVIEVMTPRQIRLGRTPPLEVCWELVAMDMDRTWVLGEATGPKARTKGTAEQLFLGLWGREPLSMEGDQRAIDALTKAVLTP